MASSDQQDSSSCHRTPPLVFDEVRWVIQIRQSLAEDSSSSSSSSDDDIPVSIFNVPKQLRAHKPEAYTPQFMALGPYHHWRPELYETERYKLAAARRAQKRLLRRAGPGLNLDVLADQLARLDRRVRAHYHRYLDLSAETLAWMMLVDAAFLLEFLHVYTDAEAKDGDGKKKHLVDFAGRKSSAHSLILRDMMMLENQVPLFLLRRILEPQCLTAAEAGELLPRMVAGLMRELSPFKSMVDVDGKFPSTIDVGKSGHLLEVLYSLLVPKNPAADDGAEANAFHGSLREDGDIEEQLEQQPLDGGGDEEEGEKPAAGCEYVKQLLLTVTSMASGLNNSRLRYVTRPLSFAVKAPWKMLTVVPGFSAMKQPVEAFFSMSGASDGSTTHSGHDANGSGYLARPPLIEEIMIPSVSELASAGVRFCPTSGDLSTIAFDCRTATFHLPAVTVDANTETVLRNLVAYEASAAAVGPLVLARYTELMNGIIDADEDVALLRRSGVVLNRMKTDAEVARLWNGMARSVRLTRVAFVDRAVEEVNRYYGSRWRVKAKRFMRKYVFSSWQLLTFLAAVMMLLLTTLQAFCSVYTCSRWFGTVTVATTAE